MKTAEKLIKGCQSQVWLEARTQDGKVRYLSDSDSVITKGMIALFVRVLDDETPDAILSADLSFIDKTGLKEHLAPTRANALNLMATQMKQRALEFSAPCRCAPTSRRLFPRTSWEMSEPTRRCPNRSSE